MMGSRYNTTGPTMKRFLIPLTAALFAIPACFAESVVKCTTKSGVTFQSTPCAEGLTTVLAIQPSAIAEANLNEAAETDKLHPVAGPLPPLAAQPPPAAAQPIRAVLYSGGNELHPGISDIQVLNNRRWGKPQKITRNRAPRAWHEYWTYDTGANGGKQLHFVNGKLANVEDLQQPVRVVTVSMASVAMME